jgi:hypothetical protein
MASISIDFDKLMSNHPSLKDIRSRVRDIPAYVNETCAVQMSYALNRADAVIGDYAYPDPTVATGTVRAFQSADGFSYIFAVPDFRVYLNNQYGDAENCKGSKEKMIEQIAGRKGILAFGHRHIDLWSGTDIHRPSNYNMPYLWSTNESIRLRGIFFWEVNDSSDSGPAGCALPGY